MDEKYYKKFRSITANVISVINNINTHLFNTKLFHVQELTKKLLLASMIIFSASILAINLLQNTEAQSSPFQMTIDPQTVSIELGPGDSADIKKSIMLSQNTTNTTIDIIPTCDSEIIFSTLGNPVVETIQETILVDNSTIPGVYNCDVVFNATLDSTSPLSSTTNGTQLIEVRVPGPVLIDVVGVFNTAWPHPGPNFDPHLVGSPLYSLTADGQTYTLLGVQQASQEFGGPHKFNGKLSQVMGTLDPDNNTIEVRTIQPPVILLNSQNSHVFGTHTTGSQKWVTLLCQFNDSPGVMPQNLAYFEDEMDIMDNYWREVSYDTIDLVGSVERDWEVMAQNRTDYLDEPNPQFAGHLANLPELAQDCAAAHDADVNFPDFDGINFIFNEDLDCCSWGGGVTLNFDGENKSYSTTWMATWGWGNQDVMGQEMGHGFGLPHSSGPYGATYDSQWDVQSAGGTCDVPDPDYGCLGVHTVSVHKDALGWIDGADVYMADTSDDQEVFIERLALPTNVGNPDVYLTAQIPIGGSDTNYYTLETRKFTGYDGLGDIPGEAILIHLMDESLGDRNAQVVDDSDNDDPNDSGAQWTSGELFVDEGNDISVAIVNMTDTGFNVIINPTVADLLVEKTGPSNPVVAGTQINYTITVTNQGPDDAQNVVVVDTLHPDLEYVSDTAGCGLLNNTLTCNLGTMVNGGSDSFDVVVDIPADLVYNGGSLVGNEVEVTSDQFDDNQDNNDDSVVNNVIAETDVAILSFNATQTPDEVMLGDSFNVTLTKIVTNFGPSSPVDIDAMVVASGDGVSIVPSPVFPGVDEVEINEEAELFEGEFTVTCEEFGVHEITFSNEITPVDAEDPDLSNNEAEIKIEIDCLIPVQINIHPASDPNSVNIVKRNGVIPVAILSTLEGEYGLPLDVNATMVNSTSVHFGPADVLFNVNPAGGATEFHNAGHIEDSYELDEITQDGDLDMVLHFKAKETGLDESDLQGCVKGQMDIGGMLYTFFGCDDIRVP
jgi:uncharacterized repeat protein (TIGR01451 family)